MKLSFFLSLALYFFCVSCKKDHKDQPTEPVYVQFNPDALAFVQFPLNKYYIFKDSASGMLDSIVVTQNNLEKKFVPASTYQTPFGNGHAPAYYYQDFSFLLTKFKGTSQQTWFYGTATSDLGSPYPNSDPVSLSLLENDSIMTGYIFLYPAIRFSSPQENVDILNTITIGGQAYSNVILYSISNLIDSLDKDFVRATYFWAKDVGIIKREIKTPTTVKTEFLVRHG